MGILVITWNFPPKRGGMEELLGNLCEGLGKKHPLFVITSYAEFPPPTDLSVFRPRWPGLLTFFVYALWKSALLMRRHPDLRVVLGGSALVTPVVLAVARLFGRKTVLQVHGLDLLYSNPVYQFLVVRWVKFCDRIIANSRYTASLANSKGVPQEATAVIPPGVHWQRFDSFPCVDAIKRERGLEGRRIILFVGRLARRKGVKEFIERSLGQIAAEIPNVVLAVVGDNPTASLAHREDLFAEINEAVKTKGLQNHVCFLGWVNGNELVKVYHACDLLVLPVLPLRGDVEGFGIVLLEAAAARKPTVATSIGGIPDAIEDGKSGILVRSGDYEALSGAIVKLLRNDELRSALGEYGLRRVKENFGWERIVEKYEQALGVVAPADR